MTSSFYPRKENTAGPSTGEHISPGRVKAGAGDGNRTHIASLEGWSSAIELHPHSAYQLHTLLSPDLVPTLRCPSRFQSAGGGGRIRTYEDVRRQIYSLLPLTARQPLRDHLPPGAAVRAYKMLPRVCKSRHSLQESV